MGRRPVINTTDQIHAIRKLRKMGVPINTIARAAGVSASAVLYHVQDVVPEVGSLEQSAAYADAQRARRLAALNGEKQPETNGILPAGNGILAALRLISPFHRGL